MAAQPVGDGPAVQPDTVFLYSAAMPEHTHNVDPHEVGKFERLAERWWDPASEFKPLHDINPLRLEWVDRRAPLAGKRVLDVGCGGGLLTEAMAARGAQVTGIDMGEAPLAVARLHARASASAPTYLRASAEQLAQDQPGHYDVVTCMEMLEHVPDPSLVVAACAVLAKPGGHVFFSTINRTPRAWLYAIVGAEYVLGLLPKGTHDYSRFIRPSELDGWARGAGLELQELTGMHYNPVARNYWLAPGVDVNYLAWHTRPPA